MRMTRNAIIATVLAAGVIALIVWGFVFSRKEVAAEHQREKPIAAPSRVTTSGGASIVTLDATTVARGGIVVAPLASTSQAQQKQAFANVTDLRELLDTQKIYLSARADAERANADLTVTGREYERLRVLNDDHKNVSDKAVEAAYAAFRTAQANAGAANNATRVAYATAQQQWGVALAQRITSVSGLTPFITLEQVVLQVSLPADASAIAPPQLLVSVPDGRLVQARLLGPASRTDPKLQGRVFLYVAPGASAGLTPGMNVQVYLASGNATAGVLIPTSAVIWTQGTSCVYIEGEPGRFARRAVPLDSPAQAGWFVTSGFAPGERVVVSGAQLLLSEEFRSQVQVGEESK